MNVLNMGHSDLHRLSVPLIDTLLPLWLIQLVEVLQTISDCITQSIFRLGENLCAKSVRRREV